MNELRQTIHEPARRTRVRDECDVLIVGGGTAGFVAALAAARNGARTILIEKHGSLGGAMINGATALHSFFNMYRAFPDVERIQLVQGIPQEVVDRMAAAGGSPGHLEMSEGFDYDTVATCFDHETFKLVAFDMLEEAGVELLLHTLTVDAITENDAVQGVIVESVSGREAILAKVVIDCSGDGSVAHYAGAPTVLDAELPHRHAVAMTFGLGGVDLPRAVDYLEANDLLSQLVRGNKGSDTDDVIRIGFKLGNNPDFAAKMEAIGTWGPLSVSLHEGELTYVNTTRVTDIDPADVEGMTRAEIALRRQVAAMTDFMREKSAGLRARLRELDIDPSGRAPYPRRRMRDRPQHRGCGTGATLRRRGRALRIPRHGPSPRDQGRWALWHSLSGTVAQGRRQSAGGGQADYN